MADMESVQVNILFSIFFSLVGLSSHIFSLIECLWMKVKETLSVAFYRPNVTLVLLWFLVRLELARHLPCIKRSVNWLEGVGRASCSARTPTVQLTCMLSCCIIT